MSAKLRNSTSEDLEDLEMDMSPMIDMVFLLLIFFIVASKIVTNHIDPEVKVPLGKQAQIPKTRKAEIIINVYAGDTGQPFASEFGRSRENGKGFDDEAALSAYIGEKKRWLVGTEGADPNDIGLVIRADKASVAGRVKRAVQAGAENGITRVTFAAYQKAPKSDAYK